MRYILIFIAIAISSAFSYSFFDCPQNMTSYECERKPDNFTTKSGISYYYKDGLFYYFNGIDFVSLKYGYHENKIYDEESYEEIAVFSNLFDDPELMCSKTYTNVGHINACKGVSHKSSYTSGNDGYTSSGYSGSTYVRGHYRHYKSGKVGYVRGHYRRK